MIFDKVAGVIEKHFPALLKRVEQARIFLFPARPQDVLPKDLDAETATMLQEHFFLPFSTVAVEDPATCAIIWDTEKNQEGLSGERGFIDIEPFDAGRIGQFIEGDDPEEAAKIAKALESYPPGTMLISEGRFGPVKLRENGKIEFFGSVLWAALATKDRGILGMDVSTRPSDKKSLAMLSTVILKNVDVALQEVFYFNSPDRFILEECSVRAAERHKKQSRKKHTKERIRRHQERPLYTLLRPHQIREKLGLAPLESHGPRRPHERRRHYRTYRDDRYKEMKDKTVVIPATWVGPSEATIGNRRYKILIDR